MIAHRNAWKPQLRGILFYLLGVAAFLFFVLQWHHNLQRKGVTDFNDARVYADAIHLWKTGGDPYSSSPGALPFVYAPVFLPCAAFLSSLFPAHTGWPVYIALQSLGILAIPWLISVGYTRCRWLSPFVAMILFSLQPGFIMEYSLLTGNIANVFYPLALAAGIPGLRRNRWLLFFLVVFLGALLKPAFLALLILPILAGTHQLRWSSLCAALVFSVYAAQRVFLPQIYAHFQQNVFAEVMVTGDDGFNLFNYVHRQAQVHASLRGPYIPLAVQGLVIAALAAAFILLRKRKHEPSIAVLWVPALVALGILANPRMQHIDADVAVLPALYLCVEGIRRSATGSQAAALFAVAFTVFELLLAKQPEMGMLFLLYGSVLFVVYLLIASPELNPKPTPYLRRHST